jgi:hypothetical protein
MLVIVPKENSMLNPKIDGIPSRKNEFSDLVPQDLYTGQGKIGSKTFVYTAIGRGEIPSYRIGQKLFIPRNWRELLIEAQQGGE